MISLYLLAVMEIRSLCEHLLRVVEIRQSILALNLALQSRHAYVRVGMVGSDSLKRTKAPTQKSW